MYCFFMDGFSCIGPDRRLSLQGLGANRFFIPVCELWNGSAAYHVISIDGRFPYC